MKSWILIDNGVAHFEAWAIQAENETEAFDKFVTQRGESWKWLLDNRKDWEIVEVTDKATLIIDYDDQMYEG